MVMDTAVVDANTLSSILSACKASLAGQKIALVPSNSKHNISYLHKDLRKWEKPVTCVCVCTHVCVVGGGVLMHYGTAYIIVNQRGNVALEKVLKYITA